MNKNLAHYAFCETKMKPSLSVIIITKNAAETIERCLKSVLFADEVIVFDSGSVDQTLTLCEQYTKNIFQADWPGFGVQKNRALEKATGDWVYSIDADEWIDDALKMAIQAVIQNTTFTAFSQPRKNRCCGRWMKFGDLSHDRVTRLFKRGHAKFTEHAVHESLQTEKNIGKLHAPLLHDSFRDLSQILEKANRYSSLFAQQARGKKRGGFCRGLLSGLWIFIRGYIIRLGFLDGRAGFAIAFGNFLGAFCKYAKLAELKK